MTLKPALDRVLIKADPGERISEGGIYLLAPRADGQAAKLRTETVLAVGPGKWSADGSVRIPMSVKKGDRVWFSPVFDGIEKKKGGATVLNADELMCRDSDLWCAEEA